MVRLLHATQRFAAALAMRSTTTAMLCLVLKDCNHRDLQELPSLAVLQFILSPLLLWQSIISAVLSNALYASAFSYYHYLSFLGYSSLPFLEHTEVCKPYLGVPELRQASRYTVLKEPTVDAFDSFEVTDAYGGKIYYADRPAYTCCRCFYGL